MMSSLIPINAYNQSPRLHDSAGENLRELQRQQE